MKNSFLLMFMIVSFFLPACQKLDGYATPPDFDKKEWELAGDKQDITLTAKNEMDWWLIDWVINGEDLHSNCWDGDSRIVTYSSKEKDPDRPHVYHSGIYRFEFEDWLIWERFGNKTIRIRLTENETGKDREIRFQVQKGNAFENIHIVQKTE